MSRLGPLSLDRFQAIPGDALRALRQIPEIVEATREIAAHTALLADVAAALERVSADTRSLPPMREDMARLGNLDEGIERLDDSIDRLSTLMEKILVAVDELNATVEALRGAVAPVARLASRVPGQRKPE